MGRPSGSNRPEGATHQRVLGEPVLRRDPTAFEKLAVIEAWRTRMIEAEVNRPCELSTETKRTLTSRFQFQLPTVDKWFKIEFELRQFVPHLEWGYTACEPLDLEALWSANQRPKGEGFNAPR